MCLLFAIETGLWAYTVHSNKSTAHRIHYCMIVLGAVKVLTLLARCGLYHYIRVTGDADGWNVANYLLTSCQSMLLCSAIALIEGGWSYIAPFLGDNEKPVLMAVLPLQVCGTHLSPLQQNTSLLQNTSSMTASSSPSAQRVQTHATPRVILCLATDSLGEFWVWSFLVAGGMRGRMRWSPPIAVYPCNTHHNHRSLAIYL